ncbi:CAMK/CAMKL protein kinase [Salpingoeca rosetta]|uniref:CAMK/CAMKL protein kinase n=1 Tax=Salpingoeca rosetta (strain ATCC 50818 / BSB-021) TaxID=946362 RepID=F2UTJ6_SALR5|nr:CAMK/CAMKL protein kinase [Salpingoeca rosetta]EGD72969.1 CAMK/CAMKL protein kinase [Salpingoeca rosetta]|eukprot:XP_004987509.1 CAMK/CAMKL protein kinase [Salpingoeca rosetta]
MQQPAASPQQQQRAQPRQLHSPSESQKGPCHHSRYEQEQRSQRTSALGQPPQATAMIRSYKRFNEFLDGKKAREESRKGKRLSGYKLQRQLGQGAFAKVVQGRHSMTGDDVAIKRILKPYSNDAARTIMNEIYLMARLNHPNLVFLYQVVDTPAETALVLELGKLGTLNEHLERGIDGPLVTNILRQVMDGVRHMHTLGIAHRDIKADNVFMATPTRPLGDGAVPVHMATKSTLCTLI